MLRALDRLLSLPFRGAIRVYRCAVSPVLHAVLGPAAGCRFDPSCSRYALECYRRHNVVRATGYTLWRVARCHPFARGGHDPVPGGPPSDGGPEPATRHTMANES